MRISLVGCLALLAGCPAYCGGPSVVSGHVELAVDVDPATFTSLELRGHGMDDGEFVVEPTYRASIPIAEVTFPYAFRVEEHEPTYGDHVTMRAWLARAAPAPGQPAAPLPGEPFGKTVAQLIHVADAGSYASGVVITLDAVTR